MRRIFERFEVNISVVGMLLGACLLLVGMVTGEVAFNDVAGIGVVYALGVGLVCAVCAGGIEPTFCDSANVRNHWRGHLQIAGALVVVGLMGTSVGALWG